MPNRGFTDILFSFKRQQKILLPKVQRLRDGDSEQVIKYDSNLRNQELTFEKLSNNFDSKSALFCHLIM